MYIFRESQKLYKSFTTWSSLLYETKKQWFFSSIKNNILEPRNTTKTVNFQSNTWTAIILLEFLKETINI